MKHSGIENGRIVVTFNQQMYLLLGFFTRGSLGEVCLQGLLRHYEIHSDKKKLAELVYLEFARFLSGHLFMHSKDKATGSPVYYS